MMTARVCALVDSLMIAAIVATVERQLKFVNYVNVVMVWLAWVSVLIIGNEL